ncbi:MAG TPA: cyclic pyranopterin monophosphate synthase MoaC, partial [Syntrophorhabdus aromaticivorans]|nr:cyclic pyranopterin monophosphate synthase MoaC [Syntrophorhabdus aromaticivorans]
MKLTHIDSEGNAQMVDISEKKETQREARAFGQVRMAEET